MASFDAALGSIQSSTLPTRSRPARIWPHPPPRCRSPLAGGRRRIGARRRFPASRNGVFSSIVVGPSMAVRPTSIAIGAASIHSIISTVCELELEMWYFPISCESFEPSGSQLLKRPEHIRLHRQALLLFRQVDLPSLLSSYIVQVVIHYLDKQSAEFINSAAGAITVSYVMQLLTGRICIMCFLQRDNVLGVCKEHVNGN
uniref:Uncharacterized protein n=1 Tax=Oryza meridionalis TaxID=40149 RepID=A0A0E0C221_9ORYZ